MLSISFTVSRSTVIERPAEAVFAVVSDFNTWRSWSPWLSQEPECPVEIAGSPGETGHKQSWDGKKIGSGHIELAEIEPNRRLGYELFFLKPWKSHSKAAFTFEPDGQATTVTWSMQGTLPIFMFFMRGKMSRMVGSDYERGLAMLRDVMEAKA